MRSLVLLIGFLVAFGSLKAQLTSESLLVLKRGTASEIDAITTAEKGSLVYNTDDDKVYQFDGSVWVIVSKDGDVDATNELQALSYDPATHVVTLTNGGTIDLSDLTPDEDWTISGGNQFSAVSGNVGVGNSSPTSKLDVTGAIHSTDAVNIGPNASGSRLSVFDDGYSGSMMDIQTDDEGPLAFRILNNSYSTNLAQSFRMYQANNGQLNMSLGDLPNNFFSIDGVSGNNNGGFGFGTSPSATAFVNIERGTKDLGETNYFVLKNGFKRQGELSSARYTIGIENLVEGETTGGTAYYYGQRNMARINKGAFNFRRLYGTYSYVYNYSTEANSDNSIYASYSLAYGRSDGGTKAIFGTYTRASKTQGSGVVETIYGNNIVASRSSGSVGDVDNIYGSNIAVYGAKKTQFGQSISVSANKSDPERMYGSSIRLYGINGYTPQTMYGLNINTGKYQTEPTTAIYNINVVSTGNTDLPNNYGAKIYLKDGVNNYGVFIDAQSGSEKNYAIYANNGTSFFRDKVGMGSVSVPTDALHIGGDLRLNGALKDKNGQPGVAGQVLTSTATGTDWVDLSTLNTDDNDWTISGNDLYSTTSGNVGIGTSAPDQKLDVSGAAVIGTDNVDQTLDGQGVLQGNSSLADKGFVATPWVYARAIEAGQRSSAATLIALGSQNGFTNNDEIGFITAGVMRMIVKPNGFVGVKTTNPRSELEVSGVLIEGKPTSMFGDNASLGSCVVSHGVASFFTNEKDNNYIHIKLPYNIEKDTDMYHIRATGYRYRSGKVIDLTWVGYCYSPSNALLETNTINAGSSEFTMTQYVGSDNYIYLRFQGTTGDNYYESFRIDSMNVGNGKVLEEGDIEVISSASEKL